MATMQNQETFGRTRLSFARESDIDEFVAVLGRFERGEIGPDEWRAFRLVRGTYGQRQAGDAQMLRIKIPQGLLTVPQVNALADVAERYSRGFGHITTRQNVQLHFLKLHDVEPAMRELAAAGLTTREACGNSVRNITACPYAGVAPDEAFDVTPYAEALTRYLLRHPLSACLPRKFKIAFEGCPEDHVAAGINDIGWTAQLRHEDGRDVRGFRVTVAGGTATLCRAGHVLFEFLPAADMLDVAEAIVRVFHRLGDYKHKQRNRLKFLVRSLGWDGFRAEFERELEAVRAGGGAALPFDPDTPAVEEPPIAHDIELPSPAAIAARAGSTDLVGPGIHPRVEPRLTLDRDEFSRWLRTNVRAQSQPGWSIVTVTTVLGDLTSAQLRLLGELALALGDGTVRVTVDQNLLFRWVPSERVEIFYRSLLAAGLARAGAGTLADVTSCPGAESCKLAVTQSRGLGRLLTEQLQQQDDLVRAVPGLNIKISGCPNGCGQHHVAGIGFQGSLRKIGGRPAPHYFVMVGGGTAGGITTFGRHVATVPARRSDEALSQLVRLFTERRMPGESALAFFRRVEVGTVKEALRDLERLTPEEATADDFVDLAEDTAFDPTIQEGECSA
ncbi:MAG TPA: nitrite/sulfite reductase [Vicinamibacterales bacterium]|nr:nitrite/sulfite reductase [Vicinamibacterales bacterium]